MKSRILFLGTQTWRQEINEWQTGAITDKPQRAQKTETRLKIWQGTDFSERTTQYQLNAFNEPERITELGFDGTEDDRTTLITYQPNTGDYIVNLPTSRVVLAGDVTTDDPAARLSGAYFRYDGEASAGATPPVRGNLTETLRWTGSGENRSLVQAFAYDDWGNVTSETDAKSRVTTHSYDTALKLFRTSSSNALGHTASTSWETGCQVPLSQTDPNGLVTTISYDLFCREVQTTAPNGHTVTTSYVNFGDPQEQYILTQAPSASSVAGSKTTESREYFNGFGETYKSTATGATSAIADATVTLTAYDARGNVDWTSLPLSWADALDNDATTTERTGFAYDTLGRVIQTTAADGSISTRSYDLQSATSYVTGQTHDFPAVTSQDADCYDGDDATQCGWTRSVVDVQGNVIQAMMSTQAEDSTPPATAPTSETYSTFAPVVSDMSVERYTNTSIGSASAMRAWASGNTADSTIDATGVVGENLSNTLMKFDGQIWLELGETYTFKEDVDDHALLIIDGQTILSNDAWNQTTTGNFTATGTGNFQFEFYANNGSGPGNYELQVSTDGGTSYVTVSGSPMTASGLNEARVNVIAAQNATLLPVLSSLSVEIYSGTSISTGAATSAWAANHSPGGTIQTFGLNGYNEPNTLAHFSGDIWLEAGQTVHFKEHVDDHSMLVIDGQTLLSSDTWRSDAVGQFTAAQSGAHSFDFYANNGAGQGFYHLLVSLDGGTTYASLVGSSVPAATTAQARINTLRAILNTDASDKRKHTNSGMLSPVDFEIRQQKLNAAGV